MRHQRITVAIAAGLAALLALSACSSAGNGTTSQKSTEIKGLKDISYTAKDLSKNPEIAKKRTDTIVMQMGKPGGVLLPNFMTNGWDGNAVQPIFSTLVTSDAGGNPIADLAKSWDISKDNLTYTFHLRDNLKFEDGSPLTADDVAFTLTLFNDPAYTVGDVDFTTINIKGAKEYQEGKADSISGIKVVDPQTITIQTETPNPTTLYTLGGPVLSKAYYGKDYKRGNLDYLKALYGKPLGTGPYKLKKYVEGQEIDYVANKYYYDGAPNVKNLIFKVVTSSGTSLQNFQNGEMDFYGAVPDQDTIDTLQSLGFASYKTETGADFSRIIVNNRKPYFKDKKVRQALLYGINRQQIVDVSDNGYGQVANVYAPPTMWSYTTKGINPYKYDKAKAAKLLDEAGWKVGKDGVREKDGQKFKITYLTSSSDSKEIPILDADFKALNIDFSSETLDVNTIFSRMNKSDFDLTNFSTPVLTDPDDAVRGYASTDPTVNYTGYQNSEATKLIKEGVSTSDRNERKAIYAKLYKVLNDDPPVILLDYSKVLSGWNARVTGGENITIGDNDMLMKLAKVKIAPIAK